MLAVTMQALKCGNSGLGTDPKRRWGEKASLRVGKNVAVLTYLIRGKERNTDNGLGFAIVNIDTQI